MLAACEAHAHTGHLDRVPAIVDSVLADADDPMVRAGLLRMNGRAALHLGNVDAAAALLGTLANDLAETQPQRAAEVELDRVGAFMILGDPASMLAAGARVRALGDEPTGLMADLVIGEAMIVSGAGHEGDALVSRCDGLLDVVDPMAVPIEVIGMAGQSALWIDRFDRAERVLGRVVGELRERSAVGTLPYPLAAHAHMDFRRGRWARAYADAAEAARLAEDANQESVHAFCLAALALLEAARGEPGAVENARHSRAIAERFRGEAITMYGDRAEGLAALGSADTGAAIEALERLQARTARFGAGEPGFLQWHGDLIEAYVRAGERDRAADLLAELDSLRQPWRLWVEAVTARCRGILAEGDEAERHFAEAIAAHERLPMPFEHARTLLALGERRRRERRRAEAREPLRAALDAFDRLGAAPWSAMARDELRASGTAPRRAAADSREELSAHELKVAMLVAEGLTNREVAASLFLSPKTIEHHLSQIYRKLDIRSRTQLSRVMTARLDAEQQVPGAA